MAKDTKGFASSSCAVANASLSLSLFSALENRSSSSSTEPSPFRSNFARVREPPTNGFEHFGVRARLKGELWVSARGRRMPGSCGALVRDTLEISRESRAPHRAVEGRLLGTSLLDGKRGPCTNSSAECAMIFSRRIKRKDLYCIVPAPAVIAGRG